MAALSGRRIVVAVSGGIAAYKACELVSRLKQQNADVWVVMTRNAAEFVGATTLRALSGRPVASEMFAETLEWEMQHLTLSEFAEAIIVAPATANVIGKIANGLADDLLSTAVMAAECPVLLAPAMNFRMWLNSINQANVARLRALGYVLVEPEEGRLAEGTYGKGRLASTDALIRALEAALCGGARPPTSAPGRGGGLGRLTDKRVLITAGPTREAIDPVRYISNRSSGKQGYALAEEARNRGAQVTLVSGPTDLPTPQVVERIDVISAAEMAEAVRSRLGLIDVFIGAAAVADYTPATIAGQKMKKTADTLEIELSRTEDILAMVARDAPGCLTVGFAAETHDVAANALAKLRDKHVDLIVANDVARADVGFEADENEVTIYRADGAGRRVEKTSKLAVASAVLDEVESVLASRS